jgi:hypothetical protein
VENWEEANGLVAQVPQPEHAAEDLADILHHADILHLDIDAGRPYTVTGSPVADLIVHDHDRDAAGVPENSWRTSPSSGA